MSENKGYWYLGSPYTKYPDGIHKAFEEVCVEAARLVNFGIPIYSPIAHSHSIAIAGGINPLDHSIWIPADIPLMQSAKGLIVLRMTGWDISYGLEVERDYFAKANRPIIYMTPGKVPDDLLARKNLL